MTYALRRIRSLCPECLRVIDGQYVMDAEARLVYLEKTCPAHGVFRSPAWKEDAGMPRFDEWQNSAIPTHPHRPSAAHEKGCPFDCGLCPQHAQQTCCALVEVTRRCNMNCPLCYASAGKMEADGEITMDPNIARIAAMLSTLHEYGGQANVQLSGGEPTVRDDLPEIIRLTHGQGFPFVQLNTNGLRLARQPGYAKQLKQAGLDLVYLQWDGLRENTFTILRGAPYLSDKERAAQNCIEAGLSIVMVATIVPGVNDDELGHLLRKALSFGPNMRGMHLQPVASFGRYPWSGKEILRLTLPELMNALEKQSNGLVRASDFRPPQSEHALCSFSALYQRTGKDTLELIASEQGCCCAPHAEAPQARDFVARHWGGLGLKPEAADRGTAVGDALANTKAKSISDDFDAFLSASNLRQRFTLSAMAFQDVYNLDLERVRRCHIHVVTQDRQMIPFCVYNLTSAAGVPLYRKD